MTLTYFLNGENLKRSYLGKVGAGSAEVRIATFTYFDICHRRTTLRKLYSVTVTYFFKVKNWNANTSEIDGTTYRFRYLSLMDVNVKVVLHDLDLLLKVNISKS